MPNEDYPDATCKDIKVGDTVILLPIGWVADRYANRVNKPVTVEECEDFNSKYDIARCDFGVGRGLEGFFKYRYAKVEREPDWEI
jgi:hypothetical protein